MINYAASWLINFVVFAIIVAVIDEAYENSIEKNQIKWIQLHFTDVIGTLRVLHIPAKRFLEDNIWKYGIGFDGSSIGLSHIEKSDLIAIPDLASSLVLPHENEELRIIADIYEPSLKKFEGDLT